MVQVVIQVVVHLLRMLKYGVVDDGTGYHDPGVDVFVFLTLQCGEVDGSAVYAVFGQISCVEGIFLL